MMEEITTGDIFKKIFVEDDENYMLFLPEFFEDETDESITKIRDRLLTLLAYDELTKISRKNFLTKFVQASVNFALQNKDVVAPDILTKNPELLKDMFSKCELTCFTEDFINDEEEQKNVVHSTSKTENVVKFRRSFLESCEKYYSKNIKDTNIFVIDGFINLFNTEENMSEKSNVKELAATLAYHIFYKKELPPSSIFKENKMLLKKVLRNENENLFKFNSNFISANISNDPQISQFYKTFMKEFVFCHVRHKDFIMPTKLKKSKIPDEEAAQRKMIETFALETVRVYEAYSDAHKIFKNWTNAEKDTEGYLMNHVFQLVSDNPKIWKFKDDFFDNEENNEKVLITFKNILKDQILKHEYAFLKNCHIEVTNGDRSLRDCIENEEDAKKFFKNFYTLKKKLKNKETNIKMDAKNTEFPKTLLEEISGTKNKMKFRETGSENKLSLESDSFKNIIEDIVISDSFNDFKQQEFIIESSEPLWNIKLMTELAEKIIKQTTLVNDTAFIYKKSFESEGVKDVIEDLFEHIFQINSKNELGLKSAFFSNVINDHAKTFKEMLEKNILKKEWQKLGQYIIEDTDEKTNSFPLNDSNAADTEKLAEEILMVKKNTDGTVMQYANASTLISMFDESVFEYNVEKHKKVSRVKFKKSFIDNNDSLPGNAKTFRNCLNKILLNDAIETLAKINTTITEIPSCCETFAMEKLAEKICELQVKDISGSNYPKYDKSNIQNLEITQMLEYLSKSVFVFGGNKNMIKFKKSFFDGSCLSRSGEIFKEKLKEKCELQAEKIYEFEKLKKLKIEILNYPVCFDEHDVNQFINEFDEMINTSNAKNTEDLFYDRLIYGKQETSGMIEAFAEIVFVCTGKKDTIKFAKKFFEATENIPEHFKPVKMAFEDKFGANFSKLKEYNINILNYPFCCETLIENGTLEEDINKFCDKFLLAITPDEKNLTDIVGEEMGKEMKMLSKNIAVNTLFQKVTDWAKGFENRLLDSVEANDYFSDIKSDVASMMMAGLNSLYCERLQRYGVSFHETFDLLENFLTSSNSMNDLQMTSKPCEQYKQKKILNLKTDETLITAIKVFETLKSMEKLNKIDSVICNPAFSLFCMKERVIEAFQSKDATNLIVIVEDETSEDSEEFYVSLRKIVENEKNKMIILITKNDQHLKHSIEWFHPFVKSPYYDVHEISNSFDDLSLRSQKKILNTTIEFQGENIFINELFYCVLRRIPCKKYDFSGKKMILKERLIDTDISSVIIPSTLTNLIKNERITIGEAIKPFKGYDVETYVPRKINLITIKNDYFGKKVDHCIFVIESNDVAEDVKTYFMDELQLIIIPAQLIINSIIMDESKQTKKGDYLNDISELKIKFSGPEEQKYQNVFLLLDTNKPYDQFKEICERFPSGIIHWIKMENKKFALFYSYFPVTVQDHATNFLRQFTEREKNNALSVEETSLKNIILQNRILLISDSAGMGKSTILSSLTSHLQKDNQDTNNVTWIMRIDLNQYIDFLSKEIKQDRLPIQDVLKISFIDFDGDYGKVILRALYFKNVGIPENISFENRIFEYLFKHSRMLIIFDGFDEISPDYEVIVSDLLLKLKHNTGNRMWVTARTNFQTRLEEKLNVFAYALKHFSEDDQIEFLKKFWKKRWNEPLTERHNKCMHNYAKKLVKNFQNNIGSEYRELIGIPLQIKMLGEVFEENPNKNDKSWEGCFNCLRKLKNNPAFGIKVQNVFSLYETFVEKKIYDYFLHEKKVVNWSHVYAETIKTSTLNEQKVIHKLLSFIAIKDGMETNFFNEEEEKKIQEWKAKFHLGSENVGFIDDIINNDQITFIHLTYAEYFVALFLNDKINSFRDRVFEIIEHIINKDVPIFLYCVNYLLFRKQESNPALSDKNLTLKKTFLVHAASSGFLNCIKHFTTYEDFKNDISSKKSSIFYYAVKHNQIRNVVCILIYVFNLFKRNLNFAKTPYFYVLEFLNRQTKTNHGSKTLSNLFWEITKMKQNILRPQKYKNVNIDEIFGNLSKKFDLSELLDGNYYDEYALDGFFDAASFIFIDGVLRYTDENDLKNFVYSGLKFYYAILENIYLTEEQKISILKYLLDKIRDSKTKIIHNILIAAIEEEQQEIFEHFFNDGKSFINDEAIFQCLITSCSTNNLEALKFILPFSETLELEDYKFNISPFQHALRNNSSLEVIDCLYKHTTPDLTAALHTALQAGCLLSTIKYLHTKEAPIDQSGDLWDILLKTLDQDVISYLSPFMQHIPRDDSILERSKRIFEELYNAICNGNPDQFGDLLKKYTTECFPTSVKTLYHYTVNKLPIVSRYSKMSETVRFYDNELSVINLKDWNHCTLLHYAAYFGVTKIVCTLLNKGAYYNAVLKNGLTPQQLANYKSYGEIDNSLKLVDQLFKCVVNNDFDNFCNNLEEVEKYDYESVHLKDQDGKTLMHHAVVHQDRKIMDKLKNLCREGNYKNQSYKRIIRIHSRDRIGRTPLFYAVESNNLDTVKILFKYGSYFDNQMCNDIQKNECTEFLDFVAKLFDLIYNEKLEDLKNELNLSPYQQEIPDIINIRDHRKRSLFEYAQQINDYNLFEFLLKQGAVVHNMNCTRNRKIQKVLINIEEIFEAVIEGNFDFKSIIRQIKQNGCSEFITKIKYETYFNIDKCKTLMDHAKDKNAVELINWCKQNDSSKSFNNVFKKWFCHL